MPKARSADARRRIDKAIRELRRRQAPINVNEASDHIIGDVTSDYNGPRAANISDVTTDDITGDWSSRRA